MDANGLRFWMLANAGDWQPMGVPASVYYGAGQESPRQSLRLVSRSERTLDLAPVNLSIAQSKLELVPGTIDSFGTRAYWDGARVQVMATGAFPNAIPIFVSPVDDRPVDLAIGYDGVLYIALASGAVVLQDRRDRWDPISLKVDHFSGWRLAADPSGGVWVLDRVHRQVARLHGTPFPRRPYGPYAAGTFRPTQENPDAPRLTLFEGALCSTSNR
jgi:hypothetical protein